MIAPMSMSMPPFFLLTLNSMISAALDVECHQIQTSSSRAGLKKMISDVWYKAVVPKVALLCGKTGYKLIQDGWRQGQLLGLEEYNS